MIIAGKHGQLANRLFVFGHCIGFAKEHGGRVFYPAFEEYTSYFQFAKRDLLCKFPPSPVPLPGRPDTRNKYFETVFGWSRSNRLNRRPVRWFAIKTHVHSGELCLLSEDPFRRLARTKQVVFIDGWGYRDYTAFDKHADTIRQFFQPTAPIQKNVDALLIRCRTRGDLVIGVHIRRGDYKEHREGRFFYEPCQYAHLMQATAALFPERSIHFLICSNEPVDTEAFQEFNFSLGNNQIAEDLYSFAKCDYLLGPPSTYTMWASFMGHVPLYQIFDPNAAVSLDGFQCKGGDCDVPEDHENWVKWPSH